jgi:hypothetical protein
MALTTKKDPQLRIRLPKELKDWIEEGAQRNGRSINSEVVVRLKEIMEAEKKKPQEQAVGRLKETQ